MSAAIGSRSRAERSVRQASVVPGSFLHPATVTRDDHGRPSVERLWTQQEAAAFLSVTPRYLRESNCPKILLPGNGKKGQPVVRYDPADVRAWARAWRTGASSAEREGN